MLKTYLNFLEGAVEHGNEHIQQDNHHDDVVHPVENMWSMLMTTDFTSDKPKMAQNSVLKLSSSLEEQRDGN